MRSVSTWLLPKHQKNPKVNNDTKIKDFKLDLKGLPSRQ